MDHVDSLLFSADDQAFDSFSEKQVLVVTDIFLYFPPKSWTRFHVMLLKAYHKFTLV